LLSLVTVSGFAFVNFVKNVFGFIYYCYIVLLMFDQRVAVRQLIRAVMSESCGSLRKRLLDEAENDDDSIQQKSRRHDEIESNSSSTSSSSESATLSSDDEQTASDTTSSDDMPIPFGHLHDSQVDALEC